MLYAFRNLIGIPKAMVNFTIYLTKKENFNKNFRTVSSLSKVIINKQMNLFVDKNAKGLFQLNYHKRSIKNNATTKTKNDFYHDLFLFKKV
jgi:hypothetical protein